MKKFAIAVVVLILSALSAEAGGNGAAFVRVRNRQALSYAQPSAFGYVQPQVFGYATPCSAQQFGYSQAFGCAQPQVLATPCSVQQSAFVNPLLIRRRSVFGGFGGSLGFSTRRGLFGLGFGF